MSSLSNIFVENINLIEDNIMKDYGEILKRHRISRGKSLMEIEAATGISNQNMSRWERGIVVPSIAFCEKLADYYKITLDELVGRTLEE